MRNTTERPEAVAAGTVKLVGTNVEKIVSAVTSLLENEELYKRVSEAHNPYGDGNACEKIMDSLASSMSEKASASKKGSLSNEF